jgi:hypothetical protein
VVHGVRLGAAERKRYSQLPPPTVITILTELHQFPSYITNNKVTEKKESKPGGTAYM